MLKSTDRLSSGRRPHKAERASEHSRAHHPIRYDGQGILPGPYLWQPHLQAWNSKSSTDSQPSTAFIRCSEGGTMHCRRVGVVLAVGTPTLPASSRSQMRRLRSNAPSLTLALSFSTSST